FSLRRTEGCLAVQVAAASMRERSTIASGDSGSEGAVQVSLEESVMSITLDRSALSSTLGWFIAVPLRGGRRGTGHRRAACPVGSAGLSAGGPVSGCWGHCFWPRVSR